MTIWKKSKFEECISGKTSALVTNQNTNKSSGGERKMFSILYNSEISTGHNSNNMEKE